LSRPYTAPAIRRAVEVLEHLAGSPGPVRLSDVARELACGKSTVLGILRTLEDVEWVAKDPSSGGYGLGDGLVALVRRAFGAQGIAEIARPLLEKMAERSGESAFLGLLKGGRVAIEACAEGGHEMRIAARPGGSLPLLAGATGKVFLAGMDDARVRSKLAGASLPRFTERTVTEPGGFLAAVAAARERGYAVDDEEYLRGVRAVAAPIRQGGETVAAIWVAGFSTRLTDERLALARAEVQEAARVCSALLEPAGRR
jgi:DNA-binding IclR family transcriptional regulator